MKILPLLFVITSTAALANELPTQGNTGLAVLQQQLLELQRDYQRERQTTEQRILVLQTQIEALQQVPASPQQNAREDSDSISSPTRFEISGDARLRFETNTAEDNQSGRDRGALRARLGAHYSINERLTLGTRIVTGNPDDPNSSDVTLGSFVDDLTVSLDQAFVAYDGGRFDVVGGKFANPFMHTDLVWDGDVNPVGLSASIPLIDSNNVSLRLTGIHSIVDEQALASNSYMWGGQASISFTPHADWQLRLAAARYDYTIGNLTNADAGDTRDNLLTPDGLSYLSDFDLINIIADITYRGLGNRWPIRFTGDWVRNQSAAIEEDRGYSGQWSVGHIEEPHDWRISYGYAVAETDAIFASFSNDNTPYASNYRQHALGLDYSLLDNTWLNLTAFYYRRNRPELAAFGSAEFRSRVRLNLNIEL